MKKLRIIAVLLLASVVIAGIGIGVYSYLTSLTEEPEDEFSPVKYMLPKGTIYAGKAEKRQLTVCALNGSKLSVKLGTKTFRAKKNTEAEENYSLYFIDCAFPSSKEEIESIGHVKVICEYNGETYGFMGAAVTFEDKEITTTAAFVTQISNAEPGKTKNEYYKEEALEIFADTPQSVNSAPDSSVSGKMCRIIAERADTWPGETTDDIMNPMYSSLAKGTMAYISGISSAYDSDKEETRYFYNLTCGRRILQSDAQLISGSRTDSMLSSSAGVSDGKTIIDVSSSWNVPYSFSLSPIRFFTSSGKQFNVSEFTPSEVEFTFFHTVKAAGKLDFSGSDTVKSGKWVIDEGKKTATLKLQLKASGGFYGFSAEYGGDGKLRITLNRKPKSLSGAAIVLDPGHGGKDSGALGYYGQIKECDINFAEAAALKAELESRGAVVYLTRYTDDYYSLNQRREYAYNYRPDMFISVHSNSSPDKTASGTSVYYYKPMSYRLANSIYESLVGAYEKRVYPGNSSKLAALRKGCNYNPFAVTRIDDCPSVLIELGFVSNDEECAKLCDAQVRQILAKAIAEGIEKSIKG